MRGYRRNTALIESWFELLPLQQQANARALHTLVQSTAPELETTVRGGSLVYAHRGLHVLALAPYRTHIHVQVFRSGPLLMRFPELEGSGRALRQLRVRHGQQFDTLLIESLVKAVAVEAESYVPVRRERPPV